MADSGGAGAGRMRRRLGGLEEGFPCVPSRFDQSDVDKVRDATDLVALIAEHVSLHPKGREHVGLCPFHDDHTPSLTVVTHKDNAFYKCHSCGAAGNAFNFVMDYHKMSFPEALRHLAERAGVQLSARHSRTGDDPGTSAAALRKANAMAASFFRQMLQDREHGAATRSVICDRRIDDTMVEAFGLGAAPAEWDTLLRFAKARSVGVDTMVDAGLLKPRPHTDGHYDAFRNRLIFPICDELGRPIAFGGRRLDPQDEPKYLNSAESAIFRKSKTLYGLHLAKRAIDQSKQAIVVEGYTDVIACHQAGIDNVVGTLGTALTPEHVKMLRRWCDTVVLVFDGDSAGRKAANRAIGRFADQGVELFFKADIDVKICVLPEGLDPDEILKQPEGEARFRAAIIEAENAFLYKLDSFRNELEAVSGLAAQNRCLERFMTELAGLGLGGLSGAMRRNTVSEISHRVGVSLNDIEQAITRPRQYTPPSRVDQSPQSAPADSSLDALTVSPARRRAERDVLAILIHSPDLRAQTVTAKDGGLVTVTKRFNAGAFHDPGVQRIAEAVFGRLEADADFTVQDLMGELQSPEDRRLVSDFYEQVQAQDDHTAAPSAAERLQAACAGLSKVESDESYREGLAAYRRDTRDTADADALREQINKRRKQGDLPAAMPLRIRS